MSSQRRPKRRRCDAAASQQSEAQGFLALLDVMVSASFTEKHIEDIEHISASHREHPAVLTGCVKCLLKISK
eukprot:764859-Hanusia_phi.AAC.1